MNFKDVLRDKKCPLCNYGGAVTELAEHGKDTILVGCARCGRFEISFEALEVIPPESAYLLSAVCRNWPEKVHPTILTTNFEILIDRAPRLGIVERMDALLALLAQKTSVIGYVADFDPDRDYPLLALKNKDEAVYLVDALAQRNLVRGGPKQPTLTVTALERLEEVRKAGRHSDLAFVAMWFDPSMAALYDEAIWPAVREAGYEPLRIDRHEHVNRIDDEIVGQIRRSRFMVADFTGQRLGVYFEAGLMMGLNRNVIWMCRKDELNEHKLHFDVRQYNFIDWELPKDAKTRLLHRILAIEGEGHLSKQIKYG